MAQDQIRLGMSNLEFEFLRLYEQCRQYTMTSWERLYALYKSVKYVIETEFREISLNAACGVAAA